MISPTWIVQCNLLNGDSDRIEKSCKENFIDIIMVDDVPDEASTTAYFKTFFYGSNSYIDKVLRTRVCFNPSIFSSPNFMNTVWTEKWKPHVLNDDIQVCTFKELLHMADKAPDDQFFIRPLEDSKIFNGSLVFGYELETWMGYVFHNSDVMGVKISVSPPKKVLNEWRIYVVDKRIVTGTQYKEDGLIRRNKSAPDEVLSFAEEAFTSWAPAEMFTLDIASTPEGYKVIETGCINNTSLYESDVDSFVIGITNYIERKSWNI